VISTTQGANEKAKEEKNRNELLRNTKFISSLSFLWLDQHNICGRSFAMIMQRLEFDIQKLLYLHPYNSKFVQWAFPALKLEVL
jgi:hypothetical protein